MSQGRTLESSRQLFEKVLANAVFFWVLLDFGWVLGLYHVHGTCPLPSAKEAHQIVLTHVCVDKAEKKLMKAVGGSDLEMHLMRTAKHFTCPPCGSAP